VQTVCALPTGAEKFSVVTFGDAHIGAHSMYKGIAVGGTLYDASPSEGGTIDKTMSFIKMLDTPNHFNFNAGKETGSSCVADSMIARLQYLALNAKSSEEGQYKVVIVNKGGTFTLADFRSEDAQDEDNGKTLVIFNTANDIYLDKTPRNSRKFGPTIIAPFVSRVKEMTMCAFSSSVPC
jgi:hypothetical protein